MGIDAVKKAKEYRNRAELAFADAARAKGWTVTKMGYPDFICYLPGGRTILVEVKMKKTHKLKKSQFKFMNAMKRGRVSCYKWAPDNDWLLNHIEKEKRKGT